MICNVCQGTGFKNLHQVEDDSLDLDDLDVVLNWISSNEDHDVCVCTCCGDGDSWYGEPGSHYSSDDPPGNHGPYWYNGGLCECN